MMIKHRKKAVSILLSAVMILTMWIPVSAAGENDLTLTAVLDPVTVTTADAGKTVTLTLKKNQPVDLCMMGFTVDYDKDALKLESIEGNGGSIILGDSDYYLETGMVGWDNKGTVEDVSVSEETLAVVTFSLKEGVFAKTYQVGFNGINLGKNYGLKTFVDDGTAYADLTVEPSASDEEYTASFGTPSAETVAVGQSYSVPVILAGKQTMAGAHLGLKSSSQAKITGIELEDGLKKTGEQTIAEDGSTALISFYGMDLNVSSGLTVANVILTAESAGEAVLTMTEGAAARTGEVFDIPVLLSGSGASVTVTNDAAVPSFQTHSILLSGQIGVIFYMDLPKIEGVDYKDSYVEFTVNGKTQKATFNPDQKNPSGTYYGFTCKINSVQMAEEITAVFHYGDGQTVEGTYSVEQYVESFWKNADAYNEKTRNLITALADYGHYIQPFLASVRDWEVGTDYAEMAPVNEAGESLITELKDENIEAAKKAVQDFNVVRDPGNSGIEKVSFSLYLDSNTSLYFYLTPEKDFSGDVTAELVEPADGKMKIRVEQIGERYRVAVPDISAHLLGTTCKVNVSAGGDFMLEASALSYVNLLMNSDTYKNEFAPKAMTAMYRYYAAADAVKNA